MTRFSKMSEQWSNEEPIVGRLRNFMKLWQHLRVWAIYTPISGLPEHWDNKQIHIQMLVPDAAISSEHEPSHLYFDTKSLKKQLVWNMRAPTFSAVIKGCSRSEVADCSQASSHSTDDGNTSFNGQIELEAGKRILQIASRLMTESQRWQRWTRRSLEGHQEKK